MFGKRAPVQSADARNEVHRVRVEVAWTNLSSRGQALPVSGILLYRSRSLFLSLSFSLRSCPSLCLSLFLIPSTVERSIERPHHNGSRSIAHETAARERHLGIGSSRAFATRRVLGCARALAIAVRRENYIHEDLPRTVNAARRGSTRARMARIKAAQTKPGPSIAPLPLRVAGRMERATHAPNFHPVPPLGQILVVRRRRDACRACQSARAHSIKTDLAGAAP